MFSSTRKTFSLWDLLPGNVPQIRYWHATATHKSLYIPSTFCSHKVIVHSNMVLFPDISSACKETIVQAAVDLSNYTLTPILAD